MHDVSLNRRLSCHSWLSRDDEVDVDEAVQTVRDIERPL